MWKWLAGILVVGLGALAQAQTFSGIGINGAAPVAPAYQGIGDIAPGALIYYSPGSCYTAAYSGSTAIVKDHQTGATSTTLGCSGGNVVKTAGSNLNTTCSGPCYTDTGYDQDGTDSCMGPSGAAQCIFRELVSADRHHNPTISTALSPGGTALCEHYDGWGDGNITITSGTYNSTTGVVTLTLSRSSSKQIGDMVRTFSLAGTGSFASLAGYWYIVAPTTVGGTQLSYQGPTGLGSITLSGGTAAAVNQTLTNVTNGYPGTNPPSGFGPYNEPYSILALATSDGFQNAGGNGIISASNVQGDANPYFGYNTNIASPTATVLMYNGNTLTATAATTAGTFYSLLGVFNGGSSKLCVNGVCNSVSLGGSKVWSYLEFGNGGGGWGGRLCEVAMWNSDQSANAVSFYANQKTRFGNF